MNKPARLTPGRRTFRHRVDRHRAGRQRPGAVTVDSAFYKRGDLQWRVQGTAKYCSANDTVSVYWNKAVTGGGTTPVLVGTTTPSLTLGVCDWELRVKRVVAALRPTSAGSITVKSAFGGEAPNVPFEFL